MGEVFAGHYELVDLVGLGAAGAVWRAWDHRQQAYVSAKVMRQHDAARLVRFVREHSEALRHPHVLLPRAWAGAEEQVLFAGDLVRGGSLAELLTEYGRLPDFLVAQLTEQALSALSAVHARGVAHGDVRAEKLLLEPTGSDRPHCWLSGFAAASSGDPAGDLRQLGLLVAELLGGTRPSAGVGPPPAPPEVSDRLWEWAWRLVAAGSGDAAPVSAQRARIELIETGLIPHTWPSTGVRVPDRLGALPAGWAPDGPGASRQVAVDTAAGSAVGEGAVDSAGGAGGRAEVPSDEVYEEIPALPHVVPPVTSDLSDPDVFDDDGFAGHAELVPTDPAFADPEEAPVDESAVPEPPDLAGLEFARPELADAELGEPEQTAEPEQLAAYGGLALPQEAEDPDLVDPDLADSRDLAEEAEVSDGPGQPDRPDDADGPEGFTGEPDTEEFQPRPIRVPHPPRDVQPAPPRDDQVSQWTHDAPAQDPWPQAVPDALAYDRHAGQPGDRSPEPDVHPPEQDPGEGTEQPAVWAQAPPADPYVDRQRSGISIPPAPAAYAPAAPEPSAPPATDETTLANAPEGRSELPPLDLEETEPARWRRVLLGILAVAALVGAVVGAWYLVMLYR